MGNSYKNKKGTATYRKGEIIHKAIKNRVHKVENKHNLPVKEFNSFYLGDF